MFVLISEQKLSHRKVYGSGALRLHMTSSRANWTTRLCGVLRVSQLRMQNLQGGFWQQRTCASKINFSTTCFALTIGNQVMVKIVKNKHAPPFRTAQFELHFGKGIGRESELIDLG